MGAGVEIHDRPGYSPEVHDIAYMQLVEACCRDLVGADRVVFHYDTYRTDSSDFGDITCVMPGIQFHVSGASGTVHGIDFYVTDPERMCVNAAKAQLFIADALLGDNAAAARKIIAGYQPAFPSIRAYLDAIDEIFLDKDAIIYVENDSVNVSFTND